ncbi:hypothetical protein FQN54_009732 [Arachnomyces sp. PD_36]|nr:hypothetical protein FQN54_009732 [Arachnomyces sp. PD_36]
MATVPIRSAKRKQWAVFCTSTIVVAVFWVVTPLQSGIFAVKQVHRSSSIPIVTSNQLIPLKDQIDKLTLNFGNDAYGITWNDQPLPPFTTRNYTLAPFRPATSRPYRGVNQTLTATTTLFGTDLDCTPPVAVTELPIIKTFRGVEHGSLLSFDDGQGCVVERNAFPPDPEDSNTNSSFVYLATYNGFHSERQDLSYYMNSTGCSEGTYFASWTRQPFDAEIRKPSASLFCHTSYYQQQVQATVRLPSYSVEGVIPRGSKVPLSNQSFPVSHFEATIETQRLPREYLTSPQQDPNIRTDIDGTSAADQLYIMENLYPNVERVDSSAIIAYGVGLAGVEPEGLLQAPNLYNGFLAAHQLLFALAASKVMQEPSLPENSPVGVETTYVEAVLMVEAFTYIVIGFLCLIAITTTYVLYTYIGRPLKLRSGPDSIALNMALAHRQTKLLTMLRPFHSENIETLKKKLRGSFFRLEEQADECALIISSQNTDVVEKESVSDSRTESSRTGSSIQSWPAELTWPFGGAFIILLVGVVIGLLVLYRLIEDHNGLSLPSNNTVIQQILLLLFPTALGTLLEPVWVALNRFLCVLQPFYELHAGSAKASDSLLLQYTSVPPQLTLWRALKAKHFFLATLCATAAISNILTVSLSALFETREVDQMYPIRMEQLLLPQAYPANDTSSFQPKGGEPLQVMLANLTGNAPLPSWVSPDAYFLPVDIPSQDNETLDTRYNLRTVGIQSQLDCREMKTSGSDLLYEFTLNADATEARFSFRENKSDGRTIRCWGDNALTAPDSEIPGEDTLLYLRGSPSGKRGLEIFMQLKSGYKTATEEEEYECERMLVGGWVRSEITLESETSETLFGPAANISSASLDQSWIMCKPRYERGMFDLTVDKTGRVFDAEQVGPLNRTLNDDLGEKAWNATAPLIGYPEIDFYWHEDTIALDWVNLFIRELPGYSSIINPKVPLPDVETLATAVNQVYRQLYAITLSRNEDQLVRAPEPELVAGKKILKERKVFLSPTMFWITLAILVFDLFVALAFYLRVPRPFLPRMPTTIASLVAYFAGSNIMLDLRKSGSSQEDAISHLKTSKHRYGFGKYMGTDDQVNLGIDRQPYLFPRRDHLVVEGKHADLIRTVASSSQLSSMLPESKKNMTSPITDNEDLAEEIEAINSIYGPSTINLTTTPSSTSADSPISTTVTLQIPNHEHLSFLVGFEKSYPATTPPRIIGTDSTSGAVRGQGKKAVGILEDAVQRVWTEGSVCLFDIIEDVGEKFEELQAESGVGAGECDVEGTNTEKSAAASTTTDDTGVLPPVQTSYELDNPPNWTLSDIISEKKSVFVGRAVTVESKEEAESYLDHLLATEKKVASATHNITAWRIRQRNKQGAVTDTVIQDFDDDGETAAGGRLLHLMQLMDVWDVVVVVTRWFGGVKLGPDRFRLINAAGRDALVKGGFAKKEGVAGKMAGNNEKGRKKNKK